RRSSSRTLTFLNPNSSLSSPSRHSTALPMDPQQPEPVSYLCGGDPPPPPPLPLSFVFLLAGGLFFAQVLRALR
uniref:Uncharacterized protein n=1 Tax=Aegilops tauschii subsp. strangulata TaxID=200361 RepID=A0A452YZ70_AEGTS